MSVYLRGDSYWYEFVIHGMRYRGAIGKVSKTVAREVCAKKRLQALEGTLVTRPTKAPFLGQYDKEKDQFTGAAAEFLAYYGPNHKPSSTRRFRDCLVKLCAVFGGKRLDEIAPLMIERYKQSQKAKGLADATVNHDLRCLKHLYYMGIKWGWVRENPVRQVRLFRENNARLRFLTLEEDAVLLAQCDLRLKTFVLAAMDTGFRAGELMALRWCDVDFRRGSVLVASGYTKNGDARTNPMSKRLAEAMTKWLEAGGGTSDGLVFGRWIYREPFERARAKAKLGRDVVFHSLRHTYISRLVMAGVDVRTVQELAGHKTIGMTMRYAHLAPEHKKRAVGLLDQVLRDGVPTKSPTLEVVPMVQDVVSNSA